MSRNRGPASSLPPATVPLRTKRQITWKKGLTVSKENAVLVSVALMLVLVCCAREPTSVGANPDPRSEAYVEMAKTDLAQQLGMSPEDIILVSAERPESTSSTVFIKLAANENLYEYHGSDDEVLQVVIDPRWIPASITEQPDVEGEITHMETVSGEDAERGIVAVIHVEKSADEGISQDTTTSAGGARYDSAIITVTSETFVYRQLEDEYRLVVPDTLRIGQSIRSIFTGSLNESDPPRATAAEIVILRNGQEE